MKKIVLVLILIIGVIGFFIYQNKNDEFLSKSEEIVRNISKDQFELSEAYLGAVYFKTIDEGSSSMSDIKQRLGKIFDYEFVQVKDLKYAKEYVYKLQLENSTQEIMISWEKQPKDWLVAGVNTVSSLPVPVENIHYERVLHIVESLSEGDYEAIYQVCSPNFGEVAGLKINNANDFSNYIINELSFIKANIYSYEIIFEETINETNEKRITVAINEGNTDYYRLVFLIDETNLLTGLYIKEHHDIQDSMLFKMPSGDLSSVYKDGYMIDSFKESIDEHYTSAVRYAGHYQYFYINNDYKKMYTMLKDPLRNRFTFDEFVAYVDIMKKRVSIEFLRNELAEFVDYNMVYDKPHYSTRLIVAGDMSKDLKRNIVEKSNVVLKDYCNFVLDLDEQVIVNDSEESINNDIDGFYLTRVSSLESNKALYESLSVEEQNHIFVPENIGISAELSLEENREMRFDKIDGLIKAIKHKEYESLLTIESRYSGLETIEDVKLLMYYQEMVVGSFTGIYIPVRGYNWLMTGQYIMEYAFLNYEGQLNKLIVTFDFDNEIMDYNVLVIPREVENESF